MLRAELLLAVATVAVASGARRDGAAVPPSIHEASLEAGTRVVVAPRARAAAAAGTQLPVETVSAVVVIPVGYANNADARGSGWASFMAGHATFDLPRWGSVVGGDSTRFFATLPVDAVEAGLAELADGSARWGDPLAAFGRAARLRATRDAATGRLKELIRAAARVDVVPAAARPAGT